MTVISQADDSAGAGAGEGRLLRKEAGAVGARPPSEFVYDDGEIILELLRAREGEEEERRRFVEGLGRLRRGVDCPASSEPG
jgi:hypothetical protein